MEEEQKQQPKEAKQTKKGESHLNAKMWLLITTIVVVLALSAIAFFLGKAFFLNNQPETPTTTNQTQEKEKPADAKTVSKELKDLNLDEIKQAVEDIKTVIAAF